VLTPGAKWLGVRFGAVDVPEARKVHTRPIPRSGGLAISVSFFLAIVACTFLATNVSNLLTWNRPRTFGILGALVVFAVGLFDDFHRLGPRIKFAIQILAASLAFYGGIRIEHFAVGSTGLHFGILSWAITVFWFLLVINAVNLIDGLDGLAAGVTFFTSIMMVIMGIMQEDYLIALEFAALAGVLLGFLRYNFNPASVFMGDGGSYFIGYTIAALAIMGSIKSQVGATILIPLLALGVPIFDTILSPLRRWVRGRQMFQPDKGHIHHQLMSMGLSSRRAVLIIYGISFILCLCAIILVNLRNEMSGLILIILVITAFIIVRKLGYLEYFAVDKIYGWLRDLSDEAGLSKGRRSFLNLQMEMNRAKNIDDLWENICQALEIMRFDRGELHLLGKEFTDNGGSVTNPTETPATWAYDGSDRRRAECGTHVSKAEGRPLGIKNGFKAVHDSLHPRFIRIWARGHHRRQEDILNDGMLRIEIPIGAGNPAIARLVLIKNISLEPVQPFTLRRVEYLRRSATDSVNKLFHCVIPK